MNYSNTFNRIAASVVSLGLVAGCASRGETSLPRQEVTVSREVVNNKAVLDPCTREGIKARPIVEVGRGELVQRVNAGDSYYVAGNFYLFSERSVIEKYGALAGAVALGVLGSKLGSGSRAATAGAIGGAMVGGISGEALANREKLQRLASESGCEAYVRTLKAPVGVPIDVYTQPQRAPYPRIRYNGSIATQFDVVALNEAVNQQIVPETNGRLAYVAEANTLILK